MATSSVVRKISIEYEGKIRLVMREVPQKNRAHSVNAALAALAAGDQGKYWEMHDLLFDRWPNFDEPSLLRNARELGLDIARFQQSMNSKDHKDALERNLKVAEDFHVFMTPTFIINGKKYDGELSYQEFKKIIDNELAKAKR